MTDTELLAFVRFVFYRFNGFIPEDRMLIYALSDFRREPYYDISEPDF